jgi:phosphoribosylformimino-5-aminoimidazole carboxamide ribotide isomerase
LLKNYIDAGVKFLIIGTKAVEEPEFVKELCQKFPGQIIVGLDANNGLVATDGWAKQTTVKVVDLAKDFENYGVSSIIYTDIARDGMMNGVNVEATNNLANATTIPIIASGGVTNMDDIYNLKNTNNSNIIGAITGRAIYEGSLDFALANKELS